jgi:hypothetical protein
VSFIQPIHVLALWAVVAVDLLLRAPRPDWRRALTAMALSSPLVIYTVAAFSLDPVLRNWNLQSDLPAPHVLHYLFGYGLWLIPGLWGWRAMRRRPEAARWAAAWLVAVPGLLALPLPIQRRLVEGVQLPLVALAVLGLTVGLRRHRRWLMPLVVSASCLTTLILLVGGIAAARVPGPPIFHAADQVRIFEQVTALAGGRDVGLGAYRTGNLIPAYTPLVAYLGLTTETADFLEKRARVEAFYRSETPDVERRQLLAEGGIRFVFFGPEEWALGDFDPDTAPYLVKRLASGAYAVYEVTP